MEMKPRTDQPSAPQSRAIALATWACRACFCLVFLANIQCAFGFIFFPQDHLAAYQLSGEVGTAALQGLGVAFLMWNATYPLVIIDPQKFKVLGWVVLVQQLIGLVGESWIVSSLASSASGTAGAAIATTVLQASLHRFICFDFLGLCLMGVSFLTLHYLLRRRAR